MTETIPIKKQNGLPLRLIESPLANRMDDISKKSEPAVRRVVWGRQFLASTVVVPPDVAAPEHYAMAVLAVIRARRRVKSEQNSS